jgi:hypothetical protein
MFILRQLGGGREPVRDALRSGGRWALGCRNEDGGFGHYPGRRSDMDAVYFKFGAMIQAGIVEGVLKDLPDPRILGWGHVMPSARWEMRASKVLRSLADVAISSRGAR